MLRKLLPLLSFLPLAVLAAGPVQPGALTDNDCEITRQVVEQLCTRGFTERGFQGTYSTGGTNDRFLCGNPNSFGFLGSDKVGLYEISLESDHVGDVVLDASECKDAMQRSINAYCQATKNGEFNPPSLQHIGNGLFAT